MIAAQIVKFLLDDLDTEVAKAAAQTDPHPTENEKESGDYEKGEITLHGLEIKIENAKGSTRSGTDKNGKPWSIKMPAVYGYFVKVDGQKAPKGKDKDEIDVYIGPDAETQTVFVVNQNKIGGGFDEHKCIIGFSTLEEAVKAYDAAFTDDLGPKLRDSITTVTLDDFKAWLLRGDKNKPFKLDVAEALKVVDVLLEVLPAHMTNDEMREFILDNRLKDVGGLMDWNDAKHIASASDAGWKLTDLPVKALTNCVLEPRHKKRPNLPVIALEVGPNEYEVLDGVHRCAEANYLGLSSIPAYVGHFFGI